MVTRQPTLPRGVVIGTKFSTIKKNLHNGTLLRSGALKHPNAVEIRGHQFVPHAHIQLTACSHCHARIKGFGGGMKCSNCNFSCHSKCHSFVHFDCPGVEGYTTTASGVVKKHKFKATSYFAPCFCDLCGVLVHGLFKQGHQCAECKMNCHKRCLKYVPDTCGTDFTEQFGRLYLKMTLKTVESSSESEQQIYNLSVTVVSALNLQPMDANGFSDPYVKLYIRPDATKKTKQKTQIHKKTLNPTFNETFRYTLTEDQFDSDVDVLHLQVWDWDKYEKNDFMGAMTFPLPTLKRIASENGDKFEGWFKLLSKVQGELFHVPILNTEEKAPPRTSLTSTPAFASTMDTELQLRSPLNEPEKDVPEFTDRFNLVKVLGQGSYGKVFLAQDRNKDNAIVAIKVLQKVAMIRNNGIDDAFTERNVLSICSRVANPCPFVSTLLMALQTPERIFFVLEFISGGDLLFHLQKSKNGCFDRSQAAFYTAECIVALWFLHGHDIIYRDLKLDNILLTKQGHIKLADFGLAKENMIPGRKTSTFCGTPDYVAPEILERKPYDKAVDFWALGVLVYEMLTGEAPFGGTEENELFASIMHQPIDTSGITDHDAAHFVVQMLDRNPNMRIGSGPDAKQHITTHAFFHNLNWSLLADAAVRPPYNPHVGDPLLAANFDDTFTKRTPTLSFVEEKVVALIQQDCFHNFDFIAPGYGSSQQESQT
eukprot:m.71824 g.71824  ORF g.71824 m.71824 type:complete len:709 (+) comp24395_c0_seq2:78-2204(+)